MHGLMPITEKSQLIFPQFPILIQKVFSKFGNTNLKIVYGGKQFIRLLDEFKKVVASINVNDLSEHDIATLSGNNMTGGKTTSIIWSVCRLLNLVFYP